MVTCRILCGPRVRATLQAMCASMGAHEAMSTVLCKLVGTVIQVPVVTTLLSSI